MERNKILHITLFRKKILSRRYKKDFFAEWKTYHTEFGVWYYGTSLYDLENAEDKSVIILTPNGYRDVVSKLDNKPVSIYIYANNKTIKQRLIKRGDNPKEANRRVEHDNVDFKYLTNEVDRIVYNNDGTSIDDCIDKIIDFLEENEEKL